ncbi:2-phospho-L-lactate guanylyltransferase [soil metagenome]
MDWSVVIPVKRLALAKTRLAGGTAADLALTFAVDTVTATLATPGVARVVVVCADDRAVGVLRALGAEVVGEPPAPGLNAALLGGTAHARPGTALAALPSDLPALRAVELAQALAAAAEHPRAYLADTTGMGTTLLCAAPGVPLDPHYGPGSAYRHRHSGAVPLTGDWPTVRHDVDTPADLTAARRLGLGPATQATLATLAAPTIAACQ